MKIDYTNNDFEPEVVEDGSELKSFQDLRVYQRLYKAMKIVLKDVVPSLPREEKYDLGDQMRRACKGAPAIIAEGFAKRKQKKNWERYLIDATGECNEMIHHLSVCTDIYHQSINPDLCKTLLTEYDISARQLNTLIKVWTVYHNND